ncbi:MAG: ComF family protein [Chloroflexota bacterium]|nr:ComF family protein [Chloroflexota bacterium]
MVSVFRNAVKSAVNLVLPTYCLGCGIQGDVLCPACATTLPRLEPPFCDICSDPGIAGVCRPCRLQSRFLTANLSGIRSPYLMEGPLRKAVHSFKYGNARVAADCLGNLLADYFRDNSLPGDVLIPVPLHRSRLRQRGYNQSELLAKVVGKASGLPVETGLLTRVLNAPPQAGSPDVNRRRTNTSGAFRCGTNTTGLACILVDDVCTTGSTLGACAGALAEAGASSVWALTLAREKLEPRLLGA